ncbi:uncharacterized protein BDCG_17419 [Blastomyces dermatitidis ER-3]|uniref:Uncharacterized protein n=2 Tax=Ajellomyces dermatitidis TaxID=5039 RepID=A0A0J9EMW3_AJEDA|nr:uncharacterized protein BDCG_17419 [Blastomyces dermatitidis ER-3]KMW67427.1 hypothetical protein BDDG_12114 [Blastomyces dermatitidis ATCC 18188]OAT02159.1 hypothetical protein BDCG_17419 [Blastomyces dermatitidis ER-3]
MAKEKRRRQKRKAELALLTTGCEKVAEDIAEKLTLFSWSDLSLHASMTKPLKIFRELAPLARFSVSERIVSQLSPSCNLGP